jgi:hypothetical protein
VVRFGLVFCANIVPDKNRVMLKLITSSPPWFGGQGKYCGTGRGTICDSARSSLWSQHVFARSIEYLSSDYRLSLLGLADSRTWEVRLVSVRVEGLFGLVIINVACEVMVLPGRWPFAGRSRGTL